MGVIFYSGQKLRPCKLHRDDSIYLQPSFPCLWNLAIQHTHTFVYLPAIKAEFLRKEGAKSGNVAKEKYLHNISQMQAMFCIVLSTFCTFSHLIFSNSLWKKIPLFPLINRLAKQCLRELWNNFTSSHSQKVVEVEFEARQSYSRDYAVNQYVYGKLVIYTMIFVLTLMLSELRIGEALAKGG